MSGTGRQAREEGRVPADTLKNKEGYEISPALSSVQASWANESNKYPAWSLRKHAAIGRRRRGRAGAWWRCCVRGILAPTIARIDGINFCSVALSAQMGRRGRTICLGARRILGDILRILGIPGIPGIPGSTRESSWGPSAHVRSASLAAAESLGYAAWKIPAAETRLSN